MGEQLPSVTDWMQALASLLTLLAAIAAVVIASKAPKLAAKYAEQYRRDNAAADERQRMQMMIFHALMKGRTELLNVDTRAAINLVEVAFPHDAGVRNARRMFTRASSAQPFDANQLIACHLDLITQVARAVGLGDAIDRFDIESGYYPQALGTMDAAALVDAEAKLAKSQTVDVTSS